MSVEEVQENYSDAVAELVMLNYPKFLKYERFFTVNRIEGVPPHVAASQWLWWEMEAVVSRKARADARRT